SSKRTRSGEISARQASFDDVLRGKNAGRNRNCKAVAGEGRNMGEPIADPIGGGLGLVMQMAAGRTDHRERFLEQRFGAVEARRKMWICSGETIAQCGPTRAEPCCLLAPHDKAEVDDAVLNRLKAHIGAVEHEQLNL